MAKKSFQSSWIKGLQIPCKSKYWNCSCSIGIPQQSTMLEPFELGFKVRVSVSGLSLGTFRSDSEYDYEYEISNYWAMRMRHDRDTVT